MELVTAGEMRAIDRDAIDRIGMPSMALMENAGRAIAEEVASWDAARLAAGRREQRPPRWLILAGKGNNGGDGIVCARHLAERGFEVRLLYAVPPGDLRGEAALQRDIAARIGLPASVYGEPGGEIDWRDWDGIVDALLGTGASGPPKEPYASLIREANASGLPIVSADIPSGLDADTGRCADPSIRADMTVALALLKRGLLLAPGADAAGRVVVRPIGIPRESVRRQRIQTFALGEDDLRDMLGAWPPARRPDTHKGTYGHVLIVAGSRDMSGAGLLCARAALRGGCGLATWAVPAALALPLTGRLPEAMLRGVADGGSGDWTRTSAADVAAHASGKQAVIIGPGLGRWPDDAAWLRELWETIDAPLVLDADALNILAEAGESFPSRAAAGRSAVLTPHPGEMARLTGLTVPEVQRDRIGIARQYAASRGVTLVLKGHRTVVAEPGGTVWVNTTGNPGMATGGSGDVLAGVIGGLLAQRLDPATAAAAGVYLHGEAGDRAAAKRHHEASLLAGDLIEEL